MKFEVIGRIYAETANYAEWDSEKEFPHYPLVSEHEFEIEAENLDAAKKWLAANHPEMYMGGNIFAVGEPYFTCLAVPGYCYPEGSFETLRARVGYVTAKFA